MNSKALHQQIVEQIRPVVKHDAEPLAFQVIEFVFGLSQTRTLAETKLTISTAQQNQLDSIIHRLLQHEPWQYISGEAWFYGRKFHLTPDVLIPRPETEELVSLIVHEFKKIKNQITILDIGTGSGCIAISLALEIPSANVIATDVSEKAITVARLNAQDLQSPITFLENNILIHTLPINNLDVIVSNPPYIARDEFDTLSESVTKFEPHSALFAESNDPLQFYKAIARQSRMALKPGGKIFVEINQQFGEETKAVFSSENFRNVTLHHDISGNDRFITAEKI